MVLLALSIIFPIVALARSSVELSLNQDSNEPLRLAFGSCFRIFNFKNDIFKTINENKPHLFAWMGDAAYTDNTRKAGFVKDSSENLDYVKMRFNMTSEDYWYKEMKKSGVPVVGVWDDHDYGINNGDKTFSKKAEMREIYLDFIGEP